MRVTLISANTEKINMPTLPMGLGCVAKALQAAGHDVRFVDLMAVDQWQPALQAALAQALPDVIGISIRNIDDQASATPRFLLEQAKDVVAFCQANAPVPIVLGGAGFSIFPQRVLDYTAADMGIQGEGEAAFVVLLEKLSSGASLADVPGLFLKVGDGQAPRRFARNLDRFSLAQALYRRGDPPGQPAAGRPWDRPHGVFAARRAGRNSRYRAAKPGLCRRPQA